MLPPAAAAGGAEADFLAMPEAGNWPEINGPGRGPSRKEARPQDVRLKVTSAT